MRKLILALLLIVSLDSIAQKSTADRIYINAVIFTGDESNTAATSLAIKDSLIVYVGNDYKPYQGPKTQVIDVAGKMITPGFIDNHTHFLGGGMQLNSVNLRPAKTQADFIRILKEYAASHNDDRWIRGGDWDHEIWGGELPTRAWIDSVSGNHPAMLYRYDGHMAIANSLALQKAKITAKTADPKGGQIIRDAKGEPTGVLKDQAMDLVEYAIPQLTAQELDDCLRRAVQEALVHGVTQVHDMSTYGGWTDLYTYQRALRNHELGIRVYSFVPIRNWKTLATYVKNNGRGDDHLHWGGLKGFVDGSLGSTTAWFYEPYLDAPGSTGLQITDSVLLRQWVIAADSAGLQVATHAIGDRANDWILDVFQAANDKNGPRDRRFRVEHAQHLSAAAIHRFAAQQVIPSMQPYHAIDDGKWAYKRLDSARLKRTYAFKSLLQSGARLTFGSDWTVAPLDPIAGMYAAVTRRTLDDKNPDGWFPAEKISIADALRCYTVNNAYAGFQENKLGQLKAGYLADFLVLSGNLLTTPPEKLRDVQVLTTVVNGKVMYEKKAQ